MIRHVPVRAVNAIGAQGLLVVIFQELVVVEISIVRVLVGDSPGPPFIPGCTFVDGLGRSHQSVVTLEVGARNRRGGEALILSHVRVTINLIHTIFLLIRRLHSTAHSHHPLRIRSWLLNLFPLHLNNSMLPKQLRQQRIMTSSTATDPSFPLRPQLLFR